MSGYDINLHVWLNTEIWKYDPEPYVLERRYPPGTPAHVMLMAELTQPSAFAKYLGEPKE